MVQLTTKINFMKKIILFIVSFTCFLACREKNIDYQLPFSGEQIVMNSLFIAGEPFKVNVTHTFQPTGVVPKDIFVGDATVNVFEDGKLKETLTYDREGFYLSSQKNKTLAGRKYSVEVISVKYGKAISNQVLVPDSKSFFTYQQIPDLDYSLNRDVPKDQINVIIQDASSTKNYYGIGFRLKGEKENYGGAWFDLDLERGSVNEDKNCKFNQTIQLNGESQNVKIFSNQCFSGSNPTFRFVVEKAYYYSEKVQQVKGGYYRVINPTLRVFKFDEGYIQYLKLKKQPTDFAKAFEEPHTTYTNVKGGYGIIGAATETVQPLIMTCKVCQ